MLRQRAIATAPERLAAREALMKAEAEAAVLLRQAEAQPLLPIFRDRDGQFQALTKSNDGTGPSRWTNVDPKPAVGEPHANSLEATGPHDVYVIRALGQQKLPGGGGVDANQVLHFGETGRGFQVRGDEWIRKLRDEYGIRAYVEKLGTYEGKAAARSAETRRIDIYEGLFGRKPGFQDGSGNWIPIQKTRH